MKGIRILAPALLLLAASCGPAPQVRLDVARIGNDTIAVECRPFSTADDMMAVMQDTILLDSRGRASYSLPVGEPCIVSVKPFATSEKIPGGRRWVGNDMIDLYVAPDDRIAVGIGKDGYTLRGSRLNAAIQEVESGIAVFRSRTAEVTDLIGQAYVQGDFAAVDSLQGLLAGISGEYVNFLSASFRQRTDGPEAPYLILISPADSVRQYLDMLPRRTYEGMFRPLLDQAARKAVETVTKRKAAAVGDEAPDFTIPDADGNDVSLSDFRGKYVLLDFWGSWCYWCIKGIPQLKEASEKYGSSLAVIGIACNDTEESWREALVKYSLRSWTNLREDSAMPVPEKPTVLYGVSAFPTKVLIDPQGTVLDITEGEEPSFYGRLDEFMSEADTPSQQR